FDPRETRPAPFYPVSGPEIRVPMMFRSAALPFREDRRFMAVELPYRNFRFTLVVITTKDRPAPITEFADVTDWLSGANFERRTVALSLPKFDVRLRTDLLGPLATLGLGRAIGSSAALSGFAPNLEIVAVPHRTAISVDESGTEAAAAGGIVAVP